MKKALSLILALVLGISLCACGGNSSSELEEILCTGEWVSSDHIYYMDTIDRKIIYTTLFFFEDGTCKYIYEDYIEGKLTSTSNTVENWKIEKGKIAVFPDIVDSETDTIYYEYSDGQLIGSAWYCKSFSYQHAFTESTLPTETTVPAMTAPSKHSIGLEYTENANGTYTVVGIGSCTDREVIIPTRIDDIEVTEVGDKAFAHCSNITRVTIPESVTIIGESAFRECSNLTSVSIPEGVASIGGNAFCNCHNLASIIIPDSVTTIGEAAFHCCCNLTQLTMGKSVTSIGAGGFNLCIRLTSVTIPSSVTKINNYAFGSCRDLTQITYEGTKEQWDAIEKATWWITNSTTIIHCIDGDIAI